MLAIVLLAAAPAAEWQKVDTSNLPAGIYLEHVAMSADGEYQSTVDFQSGAIFRSEDYGMSWGTALLPSTVLPGPTTASLAVAMTSSGKKQLSLARRGTENRILELVSSDYGKTWTVNSELTVNGVSVIFIADLALSDDGSVKTLAIQSSDGLNNIVQVVKDGITTFTGKPKDKNGDEISHPFRRLAMSESGQYQSATAVSEGALVEYHGVYYSHDFGASWTQATATAGIALQVDDIAMSASGKIQTAVGRGPTFSNGFIYRSTDFGKSWTKLTTPSDQFLGVAMSADGVIQTVVETVVNPENPDVWTSLDKGASWALATVPGVSEGSNLLGVAMSSDGAFQTVVGLAEIYRYGTPPTPRSAPPPSASAWLKLGYQTIIGIVFGVVAACLPIGVAAARATTLF